MKTNREMFDFRANMPDKTSEEKANLAKKLAEQRAKGAEGIPTTAKVKDKKTPHLLIYSLCVFIFIFMFIDFFFKLAAESRWIWV